MATIAPAPTSNMPTKFGSAPDLHSAAAKHADDAPKENKLISAAFARACKHLDNDLALKLGAAAKRPF
jgi:hypothetical protein